MTTPRPIDPHTGTAPTQVSAQTTFVAAGAASVVVTGRELQATQIAREQDVIYREVPHYPLSEAEFNLLVDPPPRSHQWLPTARGAWLTSVLLLLGSVTTAVAHGEPLTAKSIPMPALIGFFVATVVWSSISIKVHFGPDRRRETIERIRKTWHYAKDSGKRQNA